MKERLRGFLGFLGLVEDEYGEYGPSSAPRPFSEVPLEEPEWTAQVSAPAPAPMRTFPTTSAHGGPLRPVSASPSPLRPLGSTSPGPLRAQSVPGGSRSVSSFSSERDVVVVSPSAYDDSRRITDYLRSNRAVVLTTLNCDQSLSRRLVDFTAGTAYALNARIEPLLRGVYLVSPQGLYVGPEVKERLRLGDYTGFDQT
ncbi:MAG TPA: cell division protein SepF [Acidimicrobiales bacterium]|nr:cell division protein SepF [Acidimicrobiales bacterium]